ncbi:histidinol-phosphatase [Bythopirellula polymerisocia]|uniref:Histidinol-phosphatase n=1 Tax=Bythopirellula polymerisocia TaxID=2528003 RepID=A0A5C6CWG7_9BACT|nr:histidinol-phosphatase [Bythopirellula polymerisocia]TWU27326.1 Histidinol-phosphatase [Bythopirellula polymerisocia]
MDPENTTKRLEFAVEIARLAGQTTLEHFRSPNLAVERKRDGSPVTLADQGAEKLLRSQISSQFPADAILGEEFGETEGTSGYQWILDPIDGTKAFICGVPLYTTLVAVMHNNEPLAGVIYAPAVDEMVYAAKGNGCWQVVSGGSPERCRVSQVASLDEAVFLTTSVRSFAEDRTPEGSAVFDALAASCRVTRTWGDAFGYLLVATGRAEIMIDAVMNLWDAAALQPIIQEAGGKFFDWQGKPSVHNGEAIATNSALAEAVLNVVKKRGNPS